MTEPPTPAQGDEQDPARIRALFASIATRYDLANHLLSGGLDHAWRRHTSRAVAARNPRTILDLATGSGDLAVALRNACPGARVAAADFCLPLLHVAAKKGVNPLVLADGMRLPFRDGVFDAITVAFGLRNMQNWDGAVREMTRILAPGGTLFILDFSLPSGLLRPVYRFYLHRILPRLAGWLTGRRDAYRYLGGSIEAFPRGRSMCALLEAGGLSNTACTPLAAGIVTLYQGSKPRATLEGNAPSFP